MGRRRRTKDDGRSVEQVEHAPALSLTLASVIERKRICERRLPLSLLLLIGDSSSALSNLLLTSSRRMQSPPDSATLDCLGHEREWVYSTVLTRGLGLTAIGAAVHNMEALPHLIELAVFACGFAFNPIMVPIWPMLVHKLTMWRVSSGRSLDVAGHLSVPGLPTNEVARVNAELYVASVFVTLLFTEICKGVFATTRPRAASMNLTTRRYGRLVTSLKSKHSFPSGDVAQAMNLCMFMARFVNVELPTKLMLFGLFLPGVSFARVFYRCHWIEDCVGGICLSWLLHQYVLQATLIETIIVIHRAVEKGLR